MVTLLTGKKGSGKTKVLIERANSVARSSDGSVVVIEKGQKLTYDLSHKARLVNADAYSISGVDALFGFASGICAGNYDLTDMFIDGTLKIIGDDKETLIKFVNKIEALTKEANTNIILSVSASNEDIPAELAHFIAK